MNRIINKKSIIYLVVLLLTLGLTIGFSAFQNELFINDILLKVRLQRDVRVSESVISKSSGAVVNDQEYNKTKLLGNITFDSTSSYVLYKVDLTNYGNVKSGLLNISGDTGLNVSICDSNASNCTNNLETPICNGTNCTLGSTKEIYVKVSPTSAGTKNIDLDLDIQPYVNITYDNIRENTSSFKTEVLETSTYQITLTSKPEEVEVGGDVTASYNKTTGVLILSNIQSDLTIHAKYLINEIADYAYIDNNPDNYVSFNNSLYRIITKSEPDDGYGNFEYRTKIIKSESIGKYAFDTNGENEFVNSSLRTQLNTAYYDTLSNSAKELIDTWLIDFNGNLPFADYFGIIEKDDYDEAGEWIRFDQFTLMDEEEGKHGAIVNGSYVEVLNETELDTHPVTWLKTNVLIVGGSGTSSDPYILELSGSGLQPNPTVISGRALTVTGSSQALVTVTNQVGTPYYSTTTQLNENNYSSASTTIPTSSSVGNYTIYYYIPATGAYKAKTGSVHTTINGLTFTVAYQKGANVSAIGKTSDSCTTSGSSLTCSVTLPSITPNAGYESVGWSLTNGDTAGVTGNYTLSANGVTLYGNAVEKRNYQNTTTLAYYGTLNSAFASVSNNQTIKVLEDVTETTNATLASGKTGIKLDLNGKIVTMSNSSITNNGELDIYNTSGVEGTIDGDSITVIDNNGTLSLNSTSSSGKTIITGSYYENNSGYVTNRQNCLLTINNNTEINSIGQEPGLYNYGIVTIIGSKIERIYNDSTGSIDISGINTQIRSSYGYGTAIINYGDITMSNGSIYSEQSATIYNYDSGTVYLFDTHLDGFSGIDNYGRAYFDNVVISGSYSNINYSSGEMEISGNNTLISSQGSHGIENGGTLNVIDGTITGSSSGVNNDGILTVGTDDSSVSTTSPVIQTTGTSNNYGIYNNGEEFNFYDGVIKSASGSGYAINNNPNQVPEGYRVQKTVNDGVESAILVAIPYRYINTSTNAKYETLNSAFGEVANNQTIKVLEDVTETTRAILGSEKTGIKLDLNGKTITMDSKDIQNNGELDIYNTSSTTGEIKGGDTTFITNNGTLSLNGTSMINKVKLNNTSSIGSYGTIRNMNSKSLTINNNVEINTVSGLPGIYNSGITTILGGIISGYNGISNQSTGELNISGSSTQITGETLDGIRNYGIVTITGGTITGASTGILAYSSSTLTLGTNDSNVSTTSPVVQSIGTSSNYGINVYSSVTFNFYDGVIKSSSGSGYAISSNPTNMADNYKLQKTVSDGVESAILVPADYKYINTTTNARYETLNEAFNSVANNQIIKVLEDVTETTNATLASGKTGIKLDLNGKTVTFNNSAIENSGELDIYNTSSTDGKINSTLAGEDTYLFSNGGTLTFNGTSSSNKIIINKTMYDPEDQTHMEFAINNNGSLIINDNTEIDSGEGTGVHNTGTLTITGGTVTGGTITGGSGIYNESTGEVNISGNNTHIVGGFVAIYNEGTTNIAGGTITGGTSTEVELTGINNWGTATITGGTITGSFGVRNASTGELNISGSSTQIIGTTDSGIISYGGTSTITGGTITGSSDGIYLRNGTLTLGVNDSNVSSTSPVIQSTATTSKYGISLDTSNNSTFNFYDGVIKSSSGSGYAISDNPTNIPEGYRIQKTVSSGVESAILVERQENYINTTTNEIYETLNDAFSNASNNQTIKVLKDAEEIASSTLASSKTGIKLDLNGKTINLNGYGITNNGSLEIKDSSETPGSINDYPGITNETTGTLFINGVNITGDYFSGSAFVNEGIATITDSSFIGGHAVVNTEDATLTINGNSYLEGREYQGLSNRGTVVINNGEIKSLNDNSIYNSSLATLTINGGTITAAYGISNYGILTITSGNVTASRGTAIYLNDGTLTLGTDDSTVSTTLPLIQTNASSSHYGIDISTSNNPIFNFYDGIIKANGSGRSISGDPTEVANLYQIKKSVDSGVESAYLIKLPSLMEGTYGDETTNYLRTNIKKQDIESLTFANSLGGHTVNGTDCWDVSTDEDGTVLAWVTDSDSDGKYEMTIGSNGTVYASSGYYLFSNLKNLDSLNGMNNFDTSKVTNMSNMFYSTGYNSTVFTLDLGDKFNTSKVTNMRFMFQNTGRNSTVFTLNLGDKFDTSNVTDMCNMFYLTGYSSTAFTLDLGDKFDTSNVTDMRFMFLSTGYNSTVFTLDLGEKFDTSKVTNMWNIFNSTGYSSPVFTLDLGDKFNTSNVTNMQSMFRNTGYESSAFTLDLGDKFDTSNVANMESMFDSTGYSSPVFTLDLGDKFDTSKVTNMGAMFYDTGYSNTSFTLDLGDKFDTSNVTNMGAMFSSTGYSNTSFTLDLGDKFDTSNVTNMQSMFSFTGYSSTAFTLDLGDKFDTSNVTNMRDMFSSTGYNSTAFTLDLEDKFDTSKVTNMIQMFYNARRIKTIYAPSSFVTTNVTNSTNMFSGCSSLVGGQGTAYNSSSPTDKTYAHIDGGTSNPGYFTDKYAVMATFYYSNGTDGTINTITTSCRKLEGQSGCTITVPSEVTSSVGKYDTTYGGVTTSFNSMSSSSLTISNDSTFYAYYSSPITIYYPNTSNGVSSSSNALYRNEYFTSDSTMNTITATSGTSTTQTTTLSLPNLLGTFEGFDLLSSYPFAVDSPQVIERPDDEMYGVSYIMEDIVFHYNSNTTSGSFTDATSTSSVRTRYFASDVDQLSVSHGNLAKVPSAVSGSVGKYNSAYKGMSSSSTAITNVTGFTGGQTYYAYYSSPVTIYYPSSTTARGSYSYYRNEYYNSAASMNSVINSSQTSTTNFTFSSAVSGYSLYGFADNASTNTRTYSSVSALAASNKTTSYAILRKSVTATFYYNSNTTAGSLTASTTTASGYQYLRCTSTAAETSNGAISVPSAVSGSVGKQNSTYKSVYTSLSNMGSVSPTTGYTTYYANYSKAVTNYYYGSSYTSRTLYRNEYFSSTSAMGARLATANNSTTNYTTAVGPGSSVWTGLSTGQDTTQEYSSVQAAADSSAGTLYTVYTFNVTYQKGNNVSAIGSTSGSCKVTTSSTSCNVTLPSITPNSGYISAGWSTTNGATSGTAAGSSYSLSANARTLYGNAKENVTTLSIGSCTGSAQAHSICNTSAVAVPSGFRSPSKITFTWTNETVTNGSPAGDMVAAAQYSTNNGSSWTYFSISGGGTYYYGAGKYCGDYVTSWSGSADAGSLPSNITHIRLVVYSNANAYAYSSIKLGSGSVKIWGS